jgi:signal transduction histidine kinase
MIELNHDLESAQKELQVKNLSLEEANQELLSLDRLKDEFISIASHELKAPLTSIKGSVDLFLKMHGESVPQTALDLLKVSQRNIDRLASLVKDLLDIARLESGRMDLELERFPLETAVRESLFSQKALADQKGVALQVSIPEDMEIEADCNRLSQVLVNLVNNAIKFTDRGTISVSAESSSDGVMLKVADTGTGIPEDALETIFDKFAQVGSTMHRNTGGTGLGGPSFAESFASTAERSMPQVS